MQSQQLINLFPCDTYDINIERKKYLYFSLYFMRWMGPSSKSRSITFSLSLFLLTCTSADLHFLPARSPSYYGSSPENSPRLSGPLLSLSTSAVHPITSVDSGTAIVFALLQAISHMRQSATRGTRTRLSARVRAAPCRRARVPPHTIPNQSRNPYVVVWLSVTIFLLHLFSLSLRFADERFRSQRTS